MKLLDRANTYRKSPVYRALQVLPTPARPWLLAVETLAGARLDRQARSYERREQHLKRELHQARSKRKKHGGGLGRLILMGGLAFAASKLLGGKR